MANWPAELDRPLPSQSRMSRRLRTVGVTQLLERLITEVKYFGSFERADAVKGGRLCRKAGQIDSPPVFGVKEYIMLKAILIGIKNAQAALIYKINIPANFARLQQHFVLSDGFMLQSRCYMRLLGSIQRNVQGKICKDMIKHLLVYNYTGKNPTMSMILLSPPYLI